MKLFTTRQIADIEKFTIENEPIKSHNLMERAADRIVNFIEDNYNGLFGGNIDFCNILYDNRKWIICGPGNNGGDGLAITRLLLNKIMLDEVYVVLFAEKDKLSKDCKKNWKKIQKCKDIKIIQTQDVSQIDIKPGDVVIDALFGIGLNRPLGEPYKSLIKKINNSGAYVISIDMPSGLLGEDNRSNDHEAIVKSNLTLTFEFPKLSFLFPENEPFVPNFEVIPIDLHLQAKMDIETPYYYIDQEEVEALIRPRKKFAEKRDFGHALLVAGSYEKTGSAILASKACLKCGVGLLHTHIPKKSVFALQTSIPEAMLSIDNHDEYFTDIEVQPYYTAIAIGPGIGVREETQKAFLKIIQQAKERKIPLIIDADGLNILSIHKEWLNELPYYTILTPHFREFDRLFGHHNSHYDRFLSASDLSKKYNIIIILKGAHTQIHVPDGRVFFNSSGTPAMAKAGIGDVLTGMLLAFTAQNYSPVDASIISVYLHGKAGQTAVSFGSDYSLLASDLISDINIPRN